MSYTKDRLFDRTLTQSEVVNSFTTPITLLTPPTGYNIIIVGEVYVNKTYAGAAFATNINSRVVGAAYIQATTDLNSLMTNTSNAVTVIRLSVSGNNLNVASGSIVFDTLTGNPTGGGTSTIRIRFFYRLVKT